jgi:hypothetical protein
MDVYEYFGRFILAEYRDGRYTAPLSPRGRRLTGGHSAFDSRLAGLVASPFVTKYASLASARRAMRKINGE